MTPCWNVQQSFSIVHPKGNAQVNLVCRTVWCDMTSEVFLKLIEVILRVFALSERQHL